MDILFDTPPRMHRLFTQKSYTHAHIDTTAIDINQAVTRILRLPSVASKSFLITIADRSVTGMVARDQMVGKWQVLLPTVR